MRNNFASVSLIDDPPLPGFDRSWDIWICQNFIGTNAQPSTMTSRPTYDSGALPK